MNLFIDIVGLSFISLHSKSSSGSPFLLQVSLSLSAATNCNLSLVFHITWRGAFFWVNPKTNFVPLMHHDPNDLRSQIRFWMPKNYIFWSKISSGLEKRDKYSKQKFRGVFSPQPLEPHQTGSDIKIVICGLFIQCTTTK